MITGILADSAHPGRPVLRPPQWRVTAGDEARPERDRTDHGSGQDDVLEDVLLQGAGSGVGSSAGAGRWDGIHGTRIDVVRW